MPLQLTPRLRGLPRERRTGPRVHADLTEASPSVSFLLPAAFRRTAGLRLALRHPMRSGRCERPAAISLASSRPLLPRQPPQQWPRTSVIAWTSRQFGVCAAPDRARSARQTQPDAIAAEPKLYSAREPSAPSAPPRFLPWRLSDAGPQPNPTASSGPLT